MRKAILAWGSAVPVRFSERSHGVDFGGEGQSQWRSVRRGMRFGCAFFLIPVNMIWPYPTLFKQTQKEQEETMVHEMGHIFGLRHFFAKVRESDRQSVLFGRQDAFTIMNYGPKSQLTDNDKQDLARLYEEVWSGKRKDVNGTPIQQVVPFSTLHTLQHYSDSRVI